MSEYWLSDRALGGNISSSSSIAIGAAEEINNINKT
jgi:hypothetical protein